MDKDTAQVIQSLAIASGAIIGGFWALYRFILERSYETALEIDIQTTYQPYQQSALLFVTVVLTNKGNRKIKAKYNLKNGYAYKDLYEGLEYSCSLQLKKIVQNTISADKHLNWYNHKDLQSVEGISTINLLNEYTVSDAGQVEYWMEPKETVYLGTPLILSPGHYLIKVTFIGDRQDTDFWSRIVHLYIDKETLLLQKSTTSQR